MDIPRIPKALFAAKMRNNMTAAEDRLYRELLVVFRPYKVEMKLQAVIGPYIADFYILPSKVVVEADGRTHFTQEAKEYDARRNRFMEKQGIKVLRFLNDEIHRNVNKVSQKILAACLPLAPDLDPYKITIVPPSRYMPTRKKIQMDWRKINQRGY